ncbi:MAG: hypothetical protein SFW36_02395 [Leptolyngbyaceae cyanobacterium bins.59]|nr:hypothetical protein [Leptolyngbyaceae cyanobacterium bins.59]
MKLANPFYYPIAILVGGIVLVLGVRVAQLSGVVMIPVAAGVATLGAAVLRSRQPTALKLDNPALERELQSVQQQAQLLARQSEVLRTEATRLLTDAVQMELLGIVQYACDRASELPDRIDALAHRLQGSDSLLSVHDLQRQLGEAEARLRNSTGVAQEQLNQLVLGLRRNIQLAQQGQDARQAQVLSLSTLILDAAGVLQALQNKLRTANLKNAEETLELRSLSEELNSFQENVDLLVS